MPIARHNISYIGQLPLSTQRRHKIACMVVKVLTADAGASMGVCVVAPAEDAGARDVVWQEVAEPVDSIARGPGLVTVAVEAMDGDDTMEETSQ